VCVYMRVCMCVCMCVFVCERAGLCVTIEEKQKY